VHITYSLRDILELKFQKKIKEDKIDAFKYFFGHAINQINTLDITDDIAQHNFGTCQCGPHSVTNPTNTYVIADAILSWPEKIQKHCDIGASRAMLSAVLRANNVNSYAVEGIDYGIKKGAIDIPLDYYAVFDFSSYSIEELDLHKYFDLTTAFEITEHIPVEKLDLFYSNMSYMSRYHLCSVHWGGVDNAAEPTTSHYTIRDTKWWVEFLSKYGDVMQVIPANNILREFDESDIIAVKFK
jgi:2-polyprenyl-3-methyl-5-hydroxy-6-metoxy-1,4-benzoquinol methylase